jgi:excinuclease ABC subunit C
MAVFTDGMVDKKEYRRFKLRTKPNNDFDMMKEVITRRLKNTRWPAPDLIIIDGGKPQVRAVQKILNSNLQFSPSAGQAISKNQKEQKLIKNWNLNIENLPIIGLAKNPDRIVIGIGNLPTMRPERHNLGYRLLQHMRDEAHRFAKKYHTYLRNHAEVVQ